eukprot:gene12637-13934_t
MATWETRGIRGEMQSRRPLHITTSHSPLHQNGSVNYADCVEYSRRRKSPRLTSNTQVFKNHIYMDDDIEDSYNCKASNVDANKHLAIEDVMSSQPSLAAYSMLNIKVLAKNYFNGFFYFGRVIQMTSDKDICIEFNNCRSMPKGKTQSNTDLHDIISFEDANRHSITLGDKVLAPFNGDGSYAPGTVVEVHDGDNSQLVTFYDGKTNAINAKDSLWISDHFYEKIRKEVHYPEPQQRRIINQKSPKLPSHSIDIFKHQYEDALQENIDKQIEEGKELLRQLKLENIGHEKSVQFTIPASSTSKEVERRQNQQYKELLRDIGCEYKTEVPALSFVKPKKDAWVLQHDGDTEGRIRKEQHQTTLPITNLEHDVKEEGYHKHRLELLNHWEKHRNSAKYSPFVTEVPEKQEKMLVEKKKEFIERRSKEKSKKRNKKKRIYMAEGKTQNGRPAMVKNHWKPTPPNAKEYQTFDGVYFPPRTDRKFLENGYSKSWTPENAGNDWKVEGKFDIITNQPKQEHSTNFVNGFGSRDLATHQKDFAKTEYRKEIREEREKKAQQDKVDKEKVKQIRQQNRILNTERRHGERREKLRQFKEGEEQNRQQKQELKESIEKFYKEKEEHAQQQKYDRMKGMREKRNMNNERRLNFDDGIVIYEKCQNEDKVKPREGCKRNAFEVELGNEIRQQELKLERLKKINEKRLNKEYSRRDKSFKSVDLNYHVKDVRIQMTRASILP